MSNTVALRAGRRFVGSANLKLPRSEVRRSFKRMKKSPPDLSGSGGSDCVQHLSLSVTFGARARVPGGHHHFFMLGVGLSERQANLVVRQGPSGSGIHGEEALAYLHMKATAIVKPNAELVAIMVRLKNSPSKPKPSKNGVARTQMDVTASAPKARSLQATKYSRTSSAGRAFNPLSPFN